jgi:thiol-disulfide isomerase/thioredoxin
MRSYLTHWRHLARMLAWGLGLTVAAAAVENSPASPDRAATDWQTYQAARNPSPEQQNQLERLSGVERMAYLENWRQAVRLAGLAFIERNPSDPRRWEVVLNFASQSPRFVKEWGALDENGVPAHPVVDEAAANAWRATVRKLQAAMAVADDLPREVQARLASNGISGTLETTIGGWRQGKPVDLAPLRRRIEAFAEQYPDSSEGGFLLLEYTAVLEETKPAEVELTWSRFQDSPNVRMAALAKDKMQFYRTAAKPLALDFTAVDGRRVDLAKLRGKVVLIDFWATWCGPCIAELPNVKKVYAAYHDHGFEVIGITVENARLASADTPEQTAAKLAKAKQALMDFVAENALAWPQFFDGRLWKGDLVARFAVNGIPAAFLLDQDGRIVSTNARGENLEAEVKRLLKR